MNKFKLPLLQMPITLLRSVNAPLSGKSKSSDQFRWFEVELYLAIEAQVTLTSDINMAVGLTNGAKGTVVDIVYSKQPNVDLPDFIIVRWPGLTFVALSRVRYISVMPVLPFDYQIALKISTGDGLFAKKIEERRLNILCNVTLVQSFENHPE